MTRFLSESLMAREPHFRLGLRQLELAHGNPSADIYLTTAIQQATRGKLKSLGLDPADTTGKELYHALLERVRADDAQLVRTLRTRAATHISAEADLVAGMAHALQENPASQTCVALKSVAFKAIIKKTTPQKSYEATRLPVTGFVPQTRSHVASTSRRAVMRVGQLAAVIQRSVQTTESYRL